jgi:hypothetical protein
LEREEEEAGHLGSEVEAGVSTPRSSGLHLGAAALSPAPEALRWYLQSPAHPPHFCLSLCALPLSSDNHLLGADIFLGSGKYCREKSKVILAGVQRKVM